MSRNGSLTPADLIGNLLVLRITCDKYDRAGQYRVDKLVADIGPDGMLTNWLHQITADCPRKQAPSFADVCGARCPDLSKVI
jgi:hypothetical protein